MLIEASPTEAKVLLENKLRSKSIRLNAIIGDREDVLTWIDLTSGLEVLSTVKELATKEHLDRIESNLKRLPKERKTEIPVKMTKLSTLLKQYNMDHVNLFSLDVEGKIRKKKKRIKKKINKHRC